MHGDLRGRRECFRRASSGPFRDLISLSTRGQETSSCTDPEESRLLRQNVRRLTDDGEFEDDLDALGYPFV